MLLSFFESDFFKANCYKIICTSLALVLYLYYYYKFSFYQFMAKAHTSNGKVKKGPTMPSFPNGWYRLCNSSDLKKG